MGDNGERRPPRPRLELLTEVEAPSDAAAIVAALERFLSDTAPAPSKERAPQSAWQRAALEEGVSRSVGLGWGPR